MSNRDRKHALAELQDMIIPGDDETVEDHSEASTSEEEDNMGGRDKEVDVEERLCKTCVSPAWDVTDILNLAESNACIDPDDDIGSSKASPLPCIGSDHGA